MNDAELQDRIAAWAGSVLRAGTAARPGFECVSMLEHWLQVELFWSAVNGGLAGFTSVAEEFPYATGKTSGKSGFNSADMVVVSEEVVAWIEMKDLGRAPHRIWANALGFRQKNLLPLSLIDPDLTVRTALASTADLKDPTSEIYAELRAKSEALPWAIVDEHRQEVRRALAKAMVGKRHVGVALCLAPAGELCKRGDGSTPFTIEDAARAITTDLDRAGAGPPRIDVVPELRLALITAVFTAESSGAGG